MQPSLVPAELDQVITRLERSPLFNLSLSSKELFHSNFLDWLCKLYPVEAGNLFASFLTVLPDSIKGPIVKTYRELANIDLTLLYENGETLIIENKVKSLPYLGQLEEYAKANPDRAKTSF